MVAHFNHNPVYHCIHTDILNVSLTTYETLSVFLRGAPERNNGKDMKYFYWTLLEYDISLLPGIHFALAKMSLTSGTEPPLPAGNSQ